MKICTKCGQKKSLDEYNWRNFRKGWRHGFCKKCHSLYRHLHYVENKRKYLLKAKEWNKKQTLLLRQFIIKYLKGNPCKDCGSNDIRVLDFDHERDKTMGIAQMIRNCHSLESVIKEIKKCSVRCSNCHRIKTFKKGSYWKTKIGL